MSAETPESIPTSADPRSQRPTKRRALSPSSAQAASVSALFSKPDRDIRISSSGRPTHSHSRPPEIVTNVQGSSAGAGSGEFHVYKAARRREYERLRAMDEDVRRERDQEVFEREKDARERRDEERTRKNRERREKMKARKGKAKTGGGGGNGNGGTRGIKPAKVGEDRGKEDENMQESEHVTAAPAAEPGLVIHDDD